MIQWPDHILIPAVMSSRRQYKCDCPPLKMWRKVLLAIALLAVVLVPFSKAQSDQIAYVEYNDDVEGKLIIHSVEVDHAGVSSRLQDIFDRENVTAVGHFQNGINSTGWATLEVKTKPSFSNEIQAESAGTVEGYLTANLITLHYANVMAPFCDGREKTCEQISKYMKKNYLWLEKMWKRLEQTDPYWHQVYLFYVQQAGIMKGIKTKYPTSALPENAIVWLNAQGDIDELAEIYKSPEEALRAPRVSRRRSHVLGSGSCSALIKVTEGSGDLLFAHTTWTSYETMLRVQKRYSLSYRLSPRHTDLIPGKDMSFSSYPGTLTSGDDFYVISSGLATMETTIGNENAELWKNVLPSQVAEGTRTMVANRLAKSGHMWVTIFAKYNSGTYNNQWMVVDYKRFKKGSGIKKLRPELLWVAEQLPGFVVSQDMTPFLKENTYWASYNVPYFPKIFNMSGTAELAKKFGDWFTWERSPRALIFKRDHDTVKDPESMLKLMRYNDFLNDPLSDCAGVCNPKRNGENAIAARSDLNPANGTYPWGALGHRNHGATDAKITSHDMAKTLQFLSESGPTHYSPSCPAFSWDTADFASTTPHAGLPITWEFDPITHKWDWPVTYPTC